MSNEEPSPHELAAMLTLSKAARDGMIRRLHYHVWALTAISLVELLVILVLALH